MAFFRSFLIENQQELNTEFSERDEAALVYFLLEARLRGSASRELYVPDDFEPPEQLPRTLAAPELLRRQLRFIGGFLCFFVAKPMGYLRDIRSFRDYFIPGFAADRAKQIQLGQALRPEFFTATLDDLTTASTLDQFFDTAAISVPEPAPA